MEINGLKFIKTNDAPETYRVYHKKGLNVALVELGFGVLTCTALEEYGSILGKVIYQKSIGDLWADCFDNNDFREKCMYILSFAIREHMSKQKTLLVS